MAIPGALSGTLSNEGQADATLGATTFSPTDTADVVVTDLTISKTASDDGTPQAAEVLNYSISVANAGAASETNVVVTDPVPANRRGAPSEPLGW